MSTLLVFASERVRDAVGQILGVHWRKSGRQSVRTIYGGYVMKKWILRSSPRGEGCWSVCIRDQLTLEEPARRLARSFRGAILLFPFAAGAYVVAPPDVANAYAVRGVDVLER